MEKKNWKENEIEEYLKKSVNQEEIPEKIKPENMKKFLEKNTIKKKRFRKWHGIAAMAACFVLVLLAGDNMKGIQREELPDKYKNQTEESVQKEDSGITYKDLYEFFKEKTEETEKSSDKWSLKNIFMKEEKIEDSTGGELAQETGQESAKEDYGETNRQEAGVDEADIIKNDGRYLYQIVTNEDYTQSVQIADTQNGLKEVARIDGFDSIYEIYVWEDTLVIQESGWAENYDETSVQTREYSTYDVMSGNPFQKIYIYNIKERHNPKEQHTFTVKGDYLDSRLTDGYLYYFMTCDIKKLNEMKKYEDYVPVLEGKAMDASSIYLPSEANTLSYLVMVSVDLRHPETFHDTKAVVSSADRVYATKSNIYITDTIYDDTAEEGIYSNRTNILRFSYRNGIIKKEAEGSVKGVLLDDMAIHESDGYLRMAVTVDSYKKRQIRDDIFGFLIGYDTTETKRDNSLYVLNKNLKVVGKIEELAEGERIYSARFMGDTGYFVTFRQTDPLFSVDLSDPQNPKILGELKISGFSEYLHFYNENLLLGIGMEADEDTGRTEGMKISMFDISNPADVTEQNKYSLCEYNYSDALYNYKAVMIDTQKNLFGFFAESFDGEEQRDYLLFTYENGTFQLKMKIPCKTEKNRVYDNVRGTYIGEILYLMYSDGRIEGYSLLDGSLLEQL